MPIDPKYGRVQLEHGHIGDDEPVVVFRAKDSVLPELLTLYFHLCHREGSPKRHLNMIMAARRRIVEWQHAYAARTPTSEASRSWMPDDPPDYDLEG